MSEESDLAGDIYEDQMRFDYDHADNNHEYEAEWAAEIEAKLKRLKAYQEIDPYPFYYRIQILSEKISQDAEELRERGERIDGLLTRLSIFLYSLGWSLGLLGRVYGVEGTAAE